MRRNRLRLIAPSDKLTVLVGIIIFSVFLSSVVLVGLSTGVLAQTLSGSAIDERGASTSIWIEAAQVKIELNSSEAGSPRLSIIGNGNNLKLPSKSQLNTALKPDRQNGLSLVTRKIIQLGIDLPKKADYAQARQEFPPPPTIHLNDSQDIFQPLTKISGINFTDDKLAVTFEIIPKLKQVNHGKPIEVSFFTSDKCIFGDGRACVFAYKSTPENNVLYISVHSGFGGEGQQLRHAIEGTSEERAGLKIYGVNKNMKRLQGAQVVIGQSGKKTQNYEVALVTRIPAKGIKGFFNLPIEQVLAYAAKFDPEVTAFINSKEPLIILETCGWRLPGDKFAPGTSKWTSSIYLTIIKQITQTGLP